MWGSPMVWPCTACGRYVPAGLAKCPNCGALRGGQRETVVRDGVPEPPLGSDAERARADDATRRILALVGDLGEDW